MLSGPEPTRSHLEEQLIDLLTPLNHLQVFLVRGLPNEGTISLDLPSYPRLQSSSWRETCRKAQWMQSVNLSKWVQYVNGFTMPRYRCSSYPDTRTN